MAKKIPMSCKKMALACRPYHQHGFEVFVNSEARVLAYLVLGGSSHNGQARAIRALCTGLLLLNRKSRGIYPDLGGSVMTLMAC
jgi:hypothetical protein